MNPLEKPEDYLLTLFEACEILGKSSRTVTRYVHKHVLHPRGIKSRQGTLEYRFSKSEVEALKQKQVELGRFEYYEPGQARRAPEATFANYNYAPPVKEQTPYLIPGISFPVAQSPTFIPPSTERVAPVREELRDDRESEKIDEPVTARMNKNDGPSPAPVVDNPTVRIHNDDEIVTLLKETTEMLRDQLRVKDNQIKNLDDKIGQLIERNRETNILLKGMQDKMVLLEKPKNERPSQAGRPEQRQASEPVKNSQAPEYSEAQPPVPSPKESKNAEPVKLKVSAGLAESNSSDTRANAIARTKDEKYEEPGKRGLFGKIFG